MFVWKTEDTTIIRKVIFKIGKYTKIIIIIVLLFFSVVFVEKLSQKGNQFFFINNRTFVQ